MSNISFPMTNGILRNIRLNDAEGREGQMLAFSERSLCVGGKKVIKAEVVLISFKKLYVHWTRNRLSHIPGQKLLLPIGCVILGN